MSITRHPRVAIIGAGSRGHAYARSIHNNAHDDPAIISAIVDPIALKRQELGDQYIWGPHKRSARDDEQFSDWQQWVEHEVSVRKKHPTVGASGEVTDAVVICVLDELHVEVVMGLKKAGLIGGARPLHVLCEKPLATTLPDVLRIFEAVAPEPDASHRAGAVTNGNIRRVQSSIFSICHVLRYSPHNTMLRKLLLEDRVVGDILSVQHTEPVGWWHFSHSYVRGNWRNSATSAPSLLTKSSHDIDFLLWMLCSPADPTSMTMPPHLPSHITSTGSLNFFRRARKPLAAGNATNCLKCPIETECIYSAKKIYVERHLGAGDTGWPVKIVAPEIEDVFRRDGANAARNILLDKLAEDYTSSTPELKDRGWYGRCVWESDNDVCDDQTVTIEWEDDPLRAQQNASGDDKLGGRGSKTATFHMIAGTEAQCERRGRVYGSKGEISYDSTTISVYDFASGQTKTFHPKQAGGGHGGGDDGLIRQFTRAVDAVKNGGLAAEEAQKLHLGCTLEEVVRSHAVVWAAEESRKERETVNWADWWDETARARQ